MPRHIVKGDIVMVTAGEDRGETGEVLRIFTKTSRVLVQGVNKQTKHLKPTQANPNGGRLEKEMPIHISNVSPVADGQASRVRFRVNADGSKERIAARNDKVLHTLRGKKKK